MKKQLLISTLALLVITATCSIASADNSFQKGLKGFGNEIGKESKSIVNDLKTSAKKDINSKATASTKSKIGNLKDIKEAKLKPLNDEIKAKKKEISAVKKSDMLETEKTARLAILNRQLKYLETKKANVENVYNGKIDALK